MGAKYEEMAVARLLQQTFQLETVDPQVISLLGDVMRLGKMTTKTFIKYSLVIESILQKSHINCRVSERARPNIFDLVHAVKSLMRLDDGIFQFARMFRDTTAAQTRGSSLLPQTRVISQAATGTSSNPPLPPAYTYKKTAVDIF
jgi:hypothetical protein